MSNDAEVESDDDEGPVKLDRCPKVIARIITLIDDAEIEIECDEDSVTTAIGRRIVRLSE